MKKFCAFITAAAVCLSLCACNSGAPKNLSERRCGYFIAAGGDGEFTVTAVSGVRETPYAMDGVASPVKPYTLITVVPKTFDMGATYTYSATVGEGKYGGTLIVHPFASSFSAEIDCEATENFSVEIKTGDGSATYELTSAVTNDMLTFDKAIDAAKNELKPSGKYEVRAKLIKNPLGQEGLCWHVSFITASGNSGVLIDPLNARVIAKKIG